MVPRAENLFSILRPMRILSGTMCLLFARGLSTTSAACLESVSAQFSLTILALQILKLAATNAVRDPKAPSPVYNIGEGLTGFVAQTRKPLRLHNLNDPAELGGKSQKLAERNTRSGTSKSTKLGQMARNVFWPFLSSCGKP